MRHLLSFFFLLLNMGSLAAQEYLFDLEHFGVGEGLPSRTVQCITQDQVGFIWASTQAGIHRFDGKRFKTYSNSFLNAPSRHISNIACDGQNRLWICSTGFARRTRFAAVLDLESDSLLSVNAATNGAITDTMLAVLGIQQSAGEPVALVLNNGTFLKVDQQTVPLGQFSGQPTPNGNLLADQAGTYWFRIDSSLQFLTQDNRLQTFTTPDRYWAYKPLIRLFGNHIVLDNDQLQMPPSRFSDEGFHQISPPPSIQSDAFRPLYQNQNLKIFSGPDRLYILDSSDRILADFPAFRDFTPNNKRRVFQTYVDRQSNIWFAAVDGLYKLTIQKNPFRISEEGRSVYGMMADSSRFWVGNFLPSTFRKHGSNDSISFTFHHFFKDSQNRTWLLPLRTVCQYFPEDSSVIERVPRMDVVFTLMFENKATGHLWLGSKSGLFRLVEEGESYQLVPLYHHPDASTAIFRHLHRSSDGIWASTSQGLLLFDPITETLVRRLDKSNGLPESDLNHLYEDSAGVFWLATREGGLVRFDRKTGSTQQFDQSSGLSHNNIYAVYPDEFGELWLPSDHGLMAFDPETGKVRVFHTENGIAHEEFNTNSHLQMPDGTLYFGGLNGLTIFHPRDLRPPTNSPPKPILVTKVSVLQENGEHFVDRTRLFERENQVTLFPGDQILELQVSYLDFVSVKNNQIAYRIPGYQESWVYPPDHHIQLMNTSIGQHVVEIRARGGSGTWTSHTLKVQVEVLPPLYLRTWFILAVIMLAVGAIWLGIRLRLRALRRDRIRLAREVRDRTRIIARQAENLRELDRTKSRFLTNIAHEIRTPLTLVIGPAEQLQQEKDIGAMRKGLDHILRNAQHLLEQVNQLLDISKLEHGKMALSPSPAEIVGLTRDLTAAFQPAARKKEIQLEVSLSPEHKMVLVDTDKWSKIVNNLVSNAIKFTPTGGTVLVQMDCGTGPGPTLIRLEVRDNGIGIDPLEIDRIFDRYYQTARTSTHEYQGTGIGLALVKELVDLMKGNVTVVSEAGEGTVFQLWLPLEGLTDGNEGLSSVSGTSSFPPTADSEGKEAWALDPIPKGDRLKLLLIEDHAEMRQFIRSCIDARVYEVVEAKDGQEGVELAMELVPDLIITDVMMPRKDGLQVTREIRGHLATSHIPLIILSAKHSTQSRLQGLQRGADAYLSKPFSPAELNIRIANLIELRQSLRERYRHSATTEADPLRQTPGTQFGKEDRFISDLNAYIREHLSDPNFKVDQVALHFGMSRSQFYRKLSGLTESKISDLVRKFRCQKAMELLRHGDLSISEVAYAVGYSSPNHFSRSFKQEFGLSPTQFLTSIGDSATTI